MMNAVADFKAPVLLNAPFGGPTPAVASKGIFSAAASPPRLCGLLRGGGMNEEVTPISVLEKIMIQTLTPAYRKGFNPFKKGVPSSPLPPPTKASDIWAEKATLFLILRRPGYVALPVTLFSHINQANTNFLHPVFKLL